MDLAEGRLEFVPGKDRGIQAHLRLLFPKIGPFIGEAVAQASPDGARAVRG